MCIRDRYITAEAVEDGRAVVSCKNKTRIIFIPVQLQRILKNYIKKAGIKSGCVFVTNGGKPLNLSLIHISVSLFTDMQLCRKILLKMKRLLRKGGKFVFAVDTVEDRCPDDAEYRTSVSVKTKDGFTLILKGKNYYDETTHTQYAPSIYELYDGTTLLQQERMDFQTHLYELGEIEPYLKDIGFSQVHVYSSYDKVIAENNGTDMFLYECSF